MSYLLAFINGMLVPFFLGLALPVFGIAILVFVVVLIVRKEVAGRAWYIIGIPVVFYIFIGLLWMLANLGVSTSSVPDNDLLPSAVPQQER